MVETLRENHARHIYLNNYGVNQPEKICFLLKEIVSKPHLATIRQSSASTGHLSRNDAEHAGEENQIEKSRNVGEHNVSIRGLRATATAAQTADKLCSPLSISSRSAASNGLPLRV